MIRTGFCRLLRALPALLVVAPCLAAAGATDTKIHARLDARIQTARPVHTIGQPVFVDLVLRNSSASAIALGEECLRPSSFEVRRAGSQGGFRARKNRGSGPVEIPARRSERRSFELTSHFKELRELGHYWVTWTCGENKAPLLHVFVAEPYDPDTDKVAAIQTAFGRIELVLMPEQAPLHVQTFVELARSGYYDGLAFQRLVAGIQIESGDRSEASASAWDHQLPPEIDTSIQPGKGLVGSVRRESAMTSATRFFILLDSMPSFKGLHTFFAYVRSGGEALDRMRGMEVLSEAGGGAWRLRESIPIEKIEILPE